MLRGTMVVGDRPRQANRRPWAYPEEPEDSAEMRRYHDLSFERPAVFPEDSSLVEVNPDDPPVVRVKPIEVGRVSGLGKVNLGLISISRGAGAVIIPIGLIATGVGGLASYASFNALARTPGTWLKIGLIAAGISTGLTALYGLIVVGAGIGVAAGAFSELEV